MKKISPLQLKDIFTWHDNYRIGDVYFSHANPFSFGNWSYIEKSQDTYRALQELRKKNVFSGVFGHSHRQLFIGKKKNTLYEMDGYSSDVNNIDQLIINVGSVGQPRGRGIGYSLLEIKDDKLLKASFKEIKINEINAENLINRTLETHSKEINEQLWLQAGYENIPTVQDNIKELADSKFTELILN